MLSRRQEFAIGEEECAGGVGVGCSVKGDRCCCPRLHCFTQRHRPAQPGSCVEVISSRESLLPRTTLNSLNSLLSPCPTLAVAGMTAPPHAATHKLTQTHTQRPPTPPSSTSDSGSPPPPRDRRNRDARDSHTPNSRPDGPMADFDPLEGYADEEHGREGPARGDGLRRRRSRAGEGSYNEEGRGSGQSRRARRNRHSMRGGKGVALEPPRDPDLFLSDDNFHVAFTPFHSAPSSRLLTCTTTPTGAPRGREDLRMAPPPAHPRRASSARCDRAWQGRELVRRHRPRARRLLPLPAHQGCVQPLGIAGEGTDVAFSRKLTSTRTVPWDLYYASYTRTVLPSSLSPTLPPEDPSVTALRAASSRSLRRAELFSLLLTFLVPAVGASILHYARGLLSDPERYINRFLIGLFVVGSSVKPVGHAVKLLKHRA